MEEKFEKLGQLIDKIENYSFAVKSNLPAQIHIEALRQGLPEIVDELKSVFIEITGENPWSDFEETLP